MSSLNWLVGLLKGSNVYDTISKILNIAAGFLANNDADKAGNDDLLAGVLSSVADAVDAYAKKDNNEFGNIVDPVLAGITRFRDEMVELGKITAPVVQPPPILPNSR